ncbi:MAG: ROK family protein [Candidatus Sulfotelmatobacter sp.]
MNSRANKASLASPAQPVSAAKGKRRSSANGHKAKPTRGKEDAIVVGVDIGGSNLRLALADTHGTVLGKWRTSTKATSSPEMVVAQIEQGVEYLLKHHSASRRLLSAIGAGVPGVTDPRAGVVLATSFLKGWRDVRFQHLLESAFGVPAAIENDVRLAALGEHWMGVARGLDDFVFLAVGTGIAAGIFANGKLIVGSNSTAGEVGYMYVPGTFEEPAEQGAPGSLESSLGGEGIRQQWLNQCGANESSRKLTATEIFEFARTGHPLAKNILDRSARLLAYTVYNISLVLNSSLFVLGGGVGVSNHLRDAAHLVLQQYDTPSCPRLVTSSLGTDAQLMGAIRLALIAAKSRTKLTT